MIRKALLPLAKILVDRQLSNRGNPFKEFEKIRDDFELPAPSKGNIFLGPIRMSAEAHLFEGLLGYFYRAQGYRVFAIMCGQTLTDCETIDYKFAIPKAKCATCFVQQKKFVDTFCIEPLYLKDYLTTKESNEIKETSRKVAANGPITYRGIDFSKHVHSGVMRVFKVSKLEEKDIDWIKRFTRTTLTTFVAGCNMMKKYAPEHLILSHGTYSTWGGLSEAANFSQVHQVVWGRGYVGTGNIMATQDGTYLFQNITEPAKNFEDVLLTKQVNEKIEEYFQKKRNPHNSVDYISYYKDIKLGDRKGSIRNKFDIAKKLPIIGFFPNIPWDGQAFSYSEAFPTIRTFVRETIAYFEQRDAVLIIRAHPAEMHVRSQGQMERFKDILDEVCPRLPENVFFLDADHEISSYQLEKEINAAILYAGTIALEFVMNGTPVIQGGNNAFTNKGFLFEPNNLVAFRKLLDKALTNQLELSEEMKVNVRKYAYHWIFRRHFPETLINFEGQLKFQGYNFSTIEEMIKNPEINEFVHCIEARQDFIYKKQED